MKSDDDEINGTKYDAKDAEDARNAVPVWCVICVTCVKEWRIQGEKRWRNHYTNSMMNCRCFWVQRHCQECSASHCPHATSLCTIKTFRWYESGSAWLLRSRDSSSGSKTTQRETRNADEQIADRPSTPRRFSFFNCIHYHVTEGQQISLPIAESQHRVWLYAWRK